MAKKLSPRFCPKSAKTIHSSKPMKKKKPTDHYYNPQQQNTQLVSTELTLSSSQFGKTHTKKRKADQDQTSFFCVFSTKNNGFLTKNNHYPHEEKDSVSTELTLFDESWISKKTKPTKTEPFAAPPPEHPIGIDPQRPKLFEDPWNIKKTLKDSDLGHMSRLLVPKDLIKNHVLPFLGADGIKKIYGSNGVPVKVWDQDSKSEHHLVFKHWKSSKSYVFIGMWHQDFVSRRSLRQGDVVGFYWDWFQPRFNFSLLQRR